MQTNTEDWQRLPGWARRRQSVWTDCPRSWAVGAAEQSDAQELAAALTPSAEGS